ncbi:MAG: nuclear transport factor 2 family protein [Myxococcales bacterium]
MPGDADARDVLAANAAFYAAFAEQDAEAMDDLWARDADVACVHPGWAALRGRDSVMASFRAILGGGATSISCRDASAHLYGEVAFVLCTEALPGGNLVATNVFVRERGRFRLVHHQASPAPRGAPSSPAPPRRDVN